MAFVALTNDSLELQNALPKVQRAVKAVRKGQNLEKFIVGRQFMLVFLVFLLTKTASHDSKRGPLNPFGWVWTHEVPTQSFSKFAV